MNTSSNKSFFAILAFVLTGTACYSQGSLIPPELPDFDRPIGYSSPILATAVRSFGESSRINLVPNVLEIKTRGDGSPDLTLFYNQNKPNGYFTINVKVGFDSDRLAKTIDDIKKNENNLRFSIIEPHSSNFKLLIPGSIGGGAAVHEVKAVGPNEFSLTFVVDDVFRRIFLSPGSARADFFSIVYEGSYRGVIRDDVGSARIGTRIYSVGSSYGGFCSLFPVVAMDIDTGRTGCHFPRYSRTLVKEIQRALRVRKLYVGPLDGVFGDKTHRAIQKFQKDRQLFADGLPSQDILDLLKAL